MDQNHDWIRNLWIDALGPRHGLALHVLALLRGYTDDRDSRAHQSLRNCMNGREDVQYHHASANRAIGDSIQPEKEGRYLFVGRARSMLSSPWGAIASHVERCQIGSFVDTMDGRPHSIEYAGRMYTRRLRYVIDHSRCDLDYAVLSLNATPIGGVPVTLISIAGLGSLGTLGLAVILERKELRNELAIQAWSVLRMTGANDARRQAEVLVRIELNEGEELETMLDALEHRNGRLPFRFRVEVVALGRRNSSDTQLSFADDIPPLLEIDLDDPAPIVRIVATQQPLRLTPCSYELLRSLIVHPNERSLAALGQSLCPASGNGIGIARGAVRARKLALDRELRHALGEAGGEIITFDTKQGCYRLRGMRVRTRTADERAA